MERISLQERGHKGENFVSLIVAFTRTAPALFGLYLGFLHSIQKKGVPAKAQKISFETTVPDPCFMCFSFFLIGDKHCKDALTGKPSDDAKEIRGGDG